MAVSESARMAEMLKLADERRASIIEATAQAWQFGPEASAKAALAATVAALRAEADYLTANKVKGHVSTCTTIRAGAGRVAAYEMKMSANSTVTGTPVPIHVPAPAGNNISAEFSGFGVPATTDPTLLTPEAMSLLDLNTHQLARCADGLHPGSALSTRKDGSTFCTACQQQLSPPVVAPEPMSDFIRNPWGNSLDTDPFAFGAPVAAPASDPIADYLSGATDTYNPQGAIVQPVPNPFNSPTGAPNNRDGQPDKRKPLTYMEARGLLLQLEPSGSQSVSAIESRQGCGMKLGFNRLERRGLIAPARPQWALIGGKAFHTLVEMMERWVWAQNRAAPGSASLAVFAPEIVPQHWTMALDKARDEAIAGTHFTVDDIRASNKGLEGYDWWRVEGADMVNRYVVTHTGQDYLSKFRLASFDGGLTPALEVEYRLNTNPLAGTALPGGAPVGSGIELHGFMDRIDVAVDGSCYIVRDFKSGRSKGSQFQGANYIHAARRTLPIPAETPILFSNYDARTGGYIDPRQLDLTITWDEVVARAEEAETANAARIYPASPGPFCGGCGHAAICPGKVA